MPESRLSYSVNADAAPLAAVFRSASRVRGVLNAIAATLFALRSPRTLPAFQTAIATRLHSWQT